MNYGRQRCCFSGTRRWSLPAVLFAAWSVTAIAQDAEPAKAAVPTAARQAEVRKLLDETFELSKANTATKKQQAAQKLMEMAGDSATAGDELYVVLVTALPLLREAGDFPTYLTAVEQLTESFQVDAEAERTKHVTDFMTACKSSSTLEPVLNEVVALVGRAARENRYRPANELLNTADKQSKRISATKLSKSLAEVRGTLREREEAFIAQTKALQTLASEPDDPKANFAVGLWLAVYESDWEQALPKLALGSDAKWKVAVAAEPKSPSEVEAQLSAADAWWEAAQSAKGEAKLTAQRRAHKWYDRHEPNVKSPLVKARVTKRLEELTTSLEAASQRTLTWSSQPKSMIHAASKAVELPIGKSIDLLEMVKLPEHALVGVWQRKAEVVIGQSSPDARFMVPVAIRGSYELHCEFTRQGGADAVLVVFPVGSSSCSLLLSAWGGICHGLQMVDGRDVKNQAAATGAVLRPGNLANGQRYKLQIDVSQNADRATIAATLDGQRIIGWQGGVSQLSCSPNIIIPCQQAVGIGIFNSPSEIHKLELRLRHGGKAYRLDDDWWNPLTPVATFPPKEIAAKCLSWKGRKYFISENAMNFAEAQHLATGLQGRLLTISSAEEEAFIGEQGRNFWMSGWRRTNSNEWRDERNRPLRFIGKWGSPDQPSMRERESNLEIRLAPSGPPGWYDDFPWGTGPHACIEWDEEYPDDK